jgi:hypothetical protein
VVEFLLCQLKHEVGWKSIPVAFHGLDKHTRLNCLEIGKVSAQHDSMTTDQEDCLLNSFARNQNAHVSPPLCSIHPRPQRDTLFTM